MIAEGVVRMSIRGRARAGLVVIVALLASVVMGSAEAQQLSIRGGGLVMPSQGFTVPSSMTGSLAPSVDIPGMPSVANGGFELPEPMKNVAVPGHKVEGRLFAPVALEKVKLDTSKGTLGVMVTIPHRKIYGTLDGVRSCGRRGTMPLSG